VSFKNNYLDMILFGFQHSRDRTEVEACFAASAGDLCADDFTADVAMYKEVLNTVCASTGEQNAAIPPK
jgi:hypothetical protein